MNLRRFMVLVVDMRIRFDVGTPTYAQFTVVIVLELAEHPIGMVVDSVSAVITLTPEQINPAPKIGTALDTDNLNGLGTTDERMIIFVDIDRLMSSDGIVIIAKPAAWPIESPRTRFTEQTSESAQHGDQSRLNFGYQFVF